MGTVSEARFGDVPHSIARTIHLAANLSTLKLLLKKAATAGSMDQFQQILTDVLTGVTISQAKVCIEDTGEA